MILTSEQVQAQVTAIRKRSGAGTRILALQHSGIWNGPRQIEIANESHEIFYCVSDLQIREALRQLEQSGRPGVILTSVDSAVLGSDVLARLARCKVHHPQNEEMLRELFSARIIDGRVLSCKPLVEALIKGANSGAYAPPSGGTLDLDSAWKALLKNLLECEVSEITLLEFLRWTINQPSRKALLSMDARLGEQLASWMLPTCGKAPGLVIKALRSELGDDLIALGLLFGVFLSLEKQGLNEGLTAEARLEQYFDHQVLDSTTKSVWYSAAETLIKILVETEVFQAKEVVQNLDRLLEKVRLVEFAGYSDYSNLGMDRRLGDLGDAILSAVVAKSEGVPASIRTLVERAEKHFWSSGENVRLQRLKMAARLLAWLQQFDRHQEDMPLPEMIAAYYAEGGFVEWGRNVIMESDPNPKVKAALWMVLESVDTKWKVFQEKFCRSFQRWSETDGELGGVIKIEDVLWKVVGPLANNVPTLLIVLDGMSMAAYRELLGDLMRRNWTEVVPAESQSACPVLAAVPSITEISRRALLSGRLPLPASGTEKSDFARNDKLFERVGGAVKPQLFVKGDLLEQGRPGVPPTVLQTIANTRCRLVAVIVNAIDDTLKSSDQTSYSWTLDHITPLHELLRAATESGRMVVLASDHGHVLDGGSEVVKQPLEETGDRHRLASGPLGQGEMQFSGPRIKAATGVDSIVALSAQRLRYQGKRRGYHGGVCPAELVVPCAIIRNYQTLPPETYRDLPPYIPEWWTLRGDSQMKANLDQPVVRSAGARLAAASNLQPDLFQLERPVKDAGKDLVSRLLLSGVYASQVKLTVRGAPPPEQLRQFLTLLEQRNGRVLREQLAQEIQMPLLRVDGLIQNYRRLLNVDGYDVISYDQQSETVSLNFQLLRSQFDI